MGTYQPISIGFGSSVNYISRYRGSKIGKKAVEGAYRVCNTNESL